MNRELIIIIVSIGMVLFFYLIQDKSASPQPALGGKLSGTAIIQDIVKQGGQTEEQLKQTLEKAFTTSPDSL